MLTSPHIDTPHGGDVYSYSLSILLNSNTREDGPGRSLLPGRIGCQADRFPVSAHPAFLLGDVNVRECFVGSIQPHQASGRFENQRVRPQVTSAQLQRSTQRRTMGVGCWVLGDPVRVSAFFKPRLPAYGDIIPHVIRPVKYKSSRSGLHKQLYGLIPTWHCGVSYHRETEPVDGGTRHTRSSYRLVGKSLNVGTLKVQTLSSDVVSKQRADMTDSSATTAN